MPTWNSSSHSSLLSKKFSLLLLASPSSRTASPFRPICSSLKPVNYPCLLCLSYVPHAIYHHILSLIPQNTRQFFPLFSVSVTTSTVQDALISHTDKSLLTACLPSHLSFILMSLRSFSNNTVWILPTCFVGPQNKIQRALIIWLSTILSTGICHDSSGYSFCYSPVVLSIVFGPTVCPNTLVRNFPSILQGSEATNTPLWPQLSQWQSSWSS